MSDVLRTVYSSPTPQSEKARGDQVANNAGGFVFSLTPKAQLRRFLILGVDGGTYYQKARKIALDNADVVVALSNTNPRLVIDEIKDVVLNNLAPRINPSLFALAIVASPTHNTDAETRSEALSLLPQVCRTATQLFIFLNYAKQFRGWGPTLRNAVSNWYLSKSPSQAAYQIVKYRQREGWTHRDVLRQAHPHGEDDFKPLFDYACGRETAIPGSLRIIEGYEKAKSAPVKELPALIEDYKLSWEMLPTEALKDANVWRALIDSGLPYTATMRQLARLTQLDVLQGDYIKIVADRLSDAEYIAKSNVHPMNILFALKTYSSGQGFRGNGSWTPVRQVVNALDAAFYASFKNVETSGKRQLIALDVSGSMSFTNIADSNITPREASAAMAMITLAADPTADIVGFTTSLAPLDLDPRRRLDDNVRAISSLPFGGTDCAKPMLYALKHRLEYDQFVVYTDNETWAGSTHPHEALKMYRDKMGIFDAKLVVVGMTATNFTIADPRDPGMLDVVGFDASAPKLISELARGDL